VIHHIRNTLLQSRDRLYTGDLLLVVGRALTDRSPTRKTATEIDIDSHHISIVTIQNRVIGEVVDYTGPFHAVRKRDTAGLPRHQTPAILGFDVRTSTTDSI
jgi:hypothetical protein